MIIDYADPNKENWFLVSWTISNKCNYRCSYCSDHLHNGTSGWPKWETVKNFVENLKLPNKQICYRITGGEPTYWKHFIDLAELVHKQGHTFTFLTNGSQTPDYFKKIDHYTSGMIISYHPEYANLENISNIIRSVKMPISINLMLSPNDIFYKQLSVAEKLYNISNNVSIWPKIILDKTSDPNQITNNVSNYTEEQLKIINSWPYFRRLDDNLFHRGEITLDGNKITANELILNGLNKHFGWKCYAGLHMLSVDMWGNVYRADCQQGGKIGNLENFKLPDSVLICKSNKCSCLSDIYLKKEI